VTGYPLLIPMPNGSFFIAAAYQLVGLSPPSFKVPVEGAFFRGADSRFWWRSAPPMNSYLFSRVRKPLSRKRGHSPSCYDGSRFVPCFSYTFSAMAWMSPRLLFFNFRLLAGLFLHKLFWRRLCAFPFHLVPRGKSERGALFLFFSH